MFSFLSNTKNDSNFTPRNEKAPHKTGHVLELFPTNLEYHCILPSLIVKREMRAGLVARDGDVEGGAGG